MILNQILHLLCEVKMKHLLIIILAILISGPIAGILLVMCDSIFIHSHFLGEDYNFYRVDVALIYAMFFYIYYFICGLPTTLLTDLIIKLFSPRRKTIFWISFIIYTLAGLVLWRGFNVQDPLFISFILIPVYTYLIVLIKVRAKYDGKRSSF